MFHLTAEHPDDIPAIDALLDRAFGADRHLKTSYRFRRHADPIDGLSWIAHSGTAIVGSIRYWPVAIGPGRAPALLLGPLAVDPDRHGVGIGAALVFHTLELAGAAGHRIVLLVGDEPYYGRFGFHSAATHGIAMPDEQPHRLLMRLLDDNALDGVGGDVTALSGGDSTDTGQAPSANAGSAAQASTIRRMVG